MAAATFGECVCGWPKAAHGAKKPAAAKPKPKPAAPPAPTPAPKPTPPPAPKAAVPPPAPKAATTTPVAPPPASKAAVPPPAMMKRQSTDAWSNEPPVPVTKSAPSAESGPCSQYRVDLTGAVFGQCKCGYAKAEHAPSAFGRGK